MSLYILKNKDNLYWSKESGFTKYANCAKLYEYEDAKRASERRNLIICNTIFTAASNGGHFVADGDPINNN